jgi:hypothetical protein
VGEAHPTFITPVTEGWKDCAKHISGRNQKRLARQTKIKDFWFTPMKVITDNPGTQYF